MLPRALARTSPQIAAGPFSSKRRWVNTTTVRVGLSVAGDVFGAAGQALGVLGAAAFKCG
jgi:hypothetical protein